MISHLRHIVPRLVMQMLQSEAQRSFFVFGDGSATIEASQANITSQAMPIADLSSSTELKPSIAAAATTTTTTTTPKLVYEVCRQRGHQCLHLDKHLARYTLGMKSLLAVGDELEKNIDDGNEGAAATANHAVKIARSAVNELQRAHNVEQHPFEQNLKFISWDTHYCLAYYVKSSYPPLEWYQTGVRLALHFGARRPDPNVKAVHSTLRQRAAELQTRLSAYESLLIHDDGLVPEGSRSNILLSPQPCASSDRTILSSREDDILVGVTLAVVRDACTRSTDLQFVSRRLTLDDICNSPRLTPSSGSSDSSASLAMLGTSVGVLPVSTLVVAPEDEHHPLLTPHLAHFSRNDSTGFLELHLQSPEDNLLKQLNTLYNTNTYK